VCVKVSVLSKGMEETVKHINEQDGEIEEMFTAYSMLLSIEEHSIQLKRKWPVPELRRNLE
jgi:hypothetical protein